MDIVLNVLVPRIVYAKADADAATSLINNIVKEIVDPAIGILFALALALFLWGIARFMFQADDETARKQGKNHIVWGLVGMFIMVSVKGIISLVTGTFGI